MTEDFMKALSQRFSIQLNPQQQRALEQLDGPVLLLAVPGSGKTTVLMARTARLLLERGVDPSRVLTVTFSRMAAADMAQRYQRLFGGTGASPRFSTIHSFCYEVVRRISKQYQRPMPELLADPSEVVRALYQAQRNGAFVERERIDEMVTAIGRCKNRMLPPEEIEKIKIEECNFPELFRAYEAYKREYRRMDYDDMLAFALEMFRSHPDFLRQYQERYDYIQVDEAQDSSLLQHRILRMLAAPAGNLFLVGDEDQSIYSFRGAYPEALLQFQREYPKAAVLRIEQNYRCTRELALRADRFIQQNQKRLPKHMFSKREAGAKIEVTEITYPDEQYRLAAGFVKRAAGSGSIAILYRANESAIPLVDALNREGIPFFVKDTRDAFFHTPHVRDFKAFLRLALDPADRPSFERIYSKTQAYLNRGALEYVQTHGGEGEDVFQVLLRAPGIDRDRVLALRSRLARLGTLPPFQALCELESGVLSHSYLDAESAGQRLSLLKSVAKGQRTIPDLLDRLTQLSELVKREPEAPPLATLSTIHSSKGLEYDHVLMVNLIEGQFPRTQCLDGLQQGDRDGYEEEVRLFYVAVTRAREQVHLFRFRIGQGRYITSRFVNQLLAEDAPRPEPRQVRPLPKPKRREKAPPPPGYRPLARGVPLRAGVPVFHSRFGPGELLRQAGGYLAVRFEDGEERLLSVVVCMENRNLFVSEDAEKIF